MVLGLVGIMAAMAMPMQTEYAMRSVREQVQEGYNQAVNLKAGVLAYESFYNDCPDNSDKAILDFGIGKALAYSGYYTNSITTGGTLNEDGGCTIELKFKSKKIHAQLKEKTVTMKLFGLKGGVPKWACYNDVVDKFQRMLPRICRFSSEDAAEVAMAPESGS